MEVNCSLRVMGSCHLLELADQTSLVVRINPLQINTIQSHLFIPKSQRWFLVNFLRKDEYFAFKMTGTAGQS